MNRAFHQQGAALAVSLILLVVITLLGVAAMRSSTLELAMAGSQQQRIEALERAQSILDGVAAHGSNFVMAGGPGYTVCTANLSAGCDAQTLILPSDPVFSSSVASGVTALVQREDPPVIAPPRGTGASIVAFDAAPFSARATYDETSLGFGRADVVQGYIILVPKGAH